MFSQQLHKFVGLLGSRTALSVISNFALPASNLITAPILARGLGVVDRGEVATVIAPLTLLYTIGIFGLNDALTYFTAQKRGRLGRVVLVSYFLAITFGLGSSLAIWAFSDFLTQGQANLARLVALVGCLVGPNLVVILFRARAAGLDRWKRILLERILTASMRVCLLLILFLSNRLTVESAAWVLALSTVAGGVAYIGMRSCRDTAGGAQTTLREFLTYSATIWIGSLSGVLLSRLDQVLMAPLSSAFELGLYVTAVTLSEIVLIVHYGISYLFFAQHSRSPDRALEAAVARTSFAVAALIGALLCVGSPWIIRVLFGADFSGAIIPTCILVAAAALGIPGSVVGAGLAARGRPQVRSTALVIAATLNIFLLFILVPSLGALGAALATLVGSLAAANINIWISKKESGTPMLEFYILKPTDIGTVVKLL